jgi:carbamoyl-phosphate synthase large subunit
MAGISLASQGVTREVVPPYFSVQGAVFPFAQVPGVDTILGPEMKSDRRGDGRRRDVRRGVRQVADRLRACGCPRAGVRFVSVRDGDKLAAVSVARDLCELGFEVLATRGTQKVLVAHGIEAASGQQGRGRAARTSST